MKKLLKNLSVAILLLSFLTGISRGQDKTDLNFSKNIILKSESTEQKIPVTVSDSCAFLNFRIAGTIQEGELTVEIYDPKGELQGNFSISCLSKNLKANKNKNLSENLSESNNNEASSSLSSSLTSSATTSTSTSSSTSASSMSSSASSVSQGRFNKSVKNPIKGNWIIKIIPGHASGKVMIDTEQEFKED
jgi:hypothetical protein